MTLRSRIVLPLLLIGATLGAACAEPDTETVHSQPREAGSSNPAEGLAGTTTGKLVPGEVMYWVASESIEPVADRTESRVTLLNAVRRYDSSANAWRELPDLPARRSPRVLDRVTVDSTLVVLFEDCDGGPIDEDVDGARDCGERVIAALPFGAKAWVSKPVAEVLGPEFGQTVTKTSVALSAIQGRLLLEGWTTDGQQVLASIDSMDLTDSRAMQAAPPEIAARFSLKSSCPVEAGLLLWTTGFAGPDGGALNHDPTNPLGRPSAAGFEASSVRVGILAPDGRWRVVADVRDYVPGPTALGCVPDGVAIIARKLDAQIPPTSQRIEALAVLSDGSASPIPVDIGDPRSPPIGSIFPSPHPPASIIGDEVLIYADLNAPRRCKFSGPIVGEIVISPAADLVFQATDDPSRPVRQVFELGQCA